MRIDLERVREEPFVWSEELAVAQESLDRPEVRDLTAVHCNGRVEHVDTGFLLRAEIAYAQILACDRCLEAFEQQVLAPVELVVLVAAESGAEGKALDVRERDLEERDLDVLSISDEQLDTEEVVREQIQLNLPMKPLCSVDCLGLCPRCGGNRNRRECSCSGEAGDPRWAALEALRDRFPSA